MKVVHVEQGSEAWFAVRSGRVTASKVADALAFLKKGEKKGGDTAARMAYKAQLAAEILTGEPDREGYVTQAMKDGKENEPAARSAYEVREDVLVDQVGFIIHPTIERAGSSPDGLVGNDGGVEFKAPKTKTHIEYMVAGILPPDYEPQVMMNLACAEREWWDFVSFGIRLPLRHQQFKVRVPRNEARIAEINQGIADFIGEVDELIARLDGMNPLIKHLRKAVKIEDALGITDDDIPAWAKQIAAADARMQELIGGD